MDVVWSPVSFMKVLLCTSSWWDEHSHPEGGRMTERKSIHEAHPLAQSLDWTLLIAAVG